MKKKVQVLLWNLIVLCIGVTPSLCRQSTKNGAKEIIDYVMEQDDNFRMGTKRDVVLVLGITGCGTTTLTSLISDAELESVNDSCAGIHITGKNHRIRGRCSKQLRTIVPDLMINPTSGISFYDCPGFSESNTVEQDLAVTFTVRKLLNFVETTKFLFTISYKSLDLDENNRSDFLDLVRFATDLVENVALFKDGIGLVVTKVPFTNTDDAQQMETIAELIQQNKRVLQSRLERGERDSYERQMDFIDNLLENDCKRIAIMHMINEIGQLNEMNQVENDKDAILNMINENLRYIYKEDSDFRYYITNDSQFYIDSVTDEIDRNLLLNFKILCSDMTRAFRQKEKQNSRNLNGLMRSFSEIYNEISQIEDTDVSTFKRKFMQFINKQGISLSTSHLNSFLKFIELFEFMKIFSNQELNISIDIQNELDMQTMTMKQYLNWYNFFIELREKLSEPSERYRLDEDSIYEKNKENDIDLYGSLFKNDKEISVTDFENEYLSKTKHLYPSIFQTIERLSINQIKLKLLEEVWDQSMHGVSIQFFEESNAKRCVFKGYNIVTGILPDSASDCLENATHIEIFALNRFIIDIDDILKLPEKYLSIIAPIWEVDKSKRGVKVISVEGNSGEPHETLTERPINYVTRG